MTLVQPPVMVQGGRRSARAVRLLLRDLLRGRQGVAGAEDLKVRPLETPGPGVRVGEGSALIHGAQPWQGAYAQTNIGDTFVPVPPTGAFARTDLLVLRIEDPEYEGDRDPRSDGVGYFHLIQGVNLEGATAPRDMTAIPLALITMPRSTSAITDGMITDIRRLANRRHDRTLLTARPRRVQRLPGEHGQWMAWPHDAAWTLDVPEWATKAAVVITVSGLRINNGNLYAGFRTVLGEGHGEETVLDDGQGQTVRSATVVVADTFPLPAHYRGTRQPLAVQTNQNDTYGRGELSVAPATTITADIEFTESRV